MTMTSDSTPSTTSSLFGGATLISAHIPPTSEWVNFFGQPRNNHPYQSVHSSPSLYHFNFYKLGLPRTFGLWFEQRCLKGVEACLRGYHDALMHAPSAIHKAGSLLQKEITTMKSHYESTTTQVWYPIEGWFGGKIMEAVINAMEAVKKHLDDNFAPTGTSIENDVCQAKVAESCDKYAVHKSVRAALKKLVPSNADELEQYLKDILDNVYPKHEYRCVICIPTCEICMVKKANITLICDSNVIAQHHILYTVEGHEPDWKNRATCLHCFAQFYWVSSKECMLAHGKCPFSKAEITPLMLRYVTWHSALDAVNDVDMNEDDEVEALVQLQMKIEEKFRNEELKQKKINQEKKEVEEKKKKQKEKEKKHKEASKLGQVAAIDAYYEE